MANKTIDITVFGSTGFTGKFVVQEIIKTAAAAFGSSPIHLGVAGRSQAKLEALVASLPTSQNVIPTVIVADVGDEESLLAMCKASRIVIACAGPFRFLGEPVIKACVAGNCHYVDITGEPEFAERIQWNYHAKAKEAQITAVHYCGFDSVPADCGVLFTKQQLEKDHDALPSTIEMNFKVHIAGSAGLAAHFATYESAVHGFSSATQLRQLRKTANRPAVPKIGPSMFVNSSPHWDSKVSAYKIPFMFADPSVVRLSQQLTLQDPDLTAVNRPPVQFAAYICIPNFATLAMMTVAGTIFGLLAKYEFGRKLLLNHPKFFTFGVFSHDGPSEQQLAETSFSQTFFATGYSKALQDQHKDSAEGLRKVKPDVEIVTSVSGKEPGYVATPTMVVQTAYTILLEKEKIPNGILTPATAFANTKLIDRLQQNGIIFSTVQKAVK